jgi:lipid II:glycine glycyltransferase (peptidoglycan interpeptide bridge formation enzyme)
MPRSHIGNKQKIAKMPEPQVQLLKMCTTDYSLRQRWEKLVQSNGACGIMQSLPWAQMKQRQGLNILHLGIFDNGELTGGAIYYMSKTQNGAGVLVAPEGPVIPWDNRQKSTQYLRLLTQAAQEYATSHGIISMRIEPRIPPPQPALLREFARAPVDLVPSETLYLDLGPEEEEILQAMKAKGRYNIRLAQKNGIVVSEHKSSQVVCEFYDAVKQASERDDFALEPESFFQHLAEVLCPSQHATFFLAKHEGELLGALLLINYGKRGTYLYGGVTNTKRNLMAGYALQWAAIRKARSLGCQTYDFYGYIKHRTPDHEYAKFSQFKSRFGGQAIRFVGAQDYFFIDNMAAALVKATTEITRHTKEKSKQ